MQKINTIIYILLLTPILLPAMNKHKKRNNKKLPYYIQQIKNHEETLASFYPQLEKNDTSCLEPIKNTFEQIIESVQLFAQTYPEVSGEVEKKIADFQKALDDSKNVSETEQLNKFKVTIGLCCLQEK